MTKKRNYDLETFGDALVVAGGEIIESYEHIGRDKDFYYWWHDTKVEVGVRSSFDRWANSRDFVLHKYIGQIDFTTLKVACLAALKSGHYNSDWALEYDIGAEYRQARRQQKEIE